MNTETWGHTFPHLMAVFPWWIGWCDIFSPPCGEGCHGDALLWQWECVCLYVCMLCVWFISFKKCCASDTFLCEGSVESMFVWPSICVSVSSYFCVSLCVFSLDVLVGSVQGAPSVWAHVWPAVGRPPWRLWQWEDPGVLWSQHSQRLLLFLQVKDIITHPKVCSNPNKNQYYTRVLMV